MRPENRTGQQHAVAMSEKMTSRDFLGIIRAPFLILDIVCPLLGLATAFTFARSLNVFHVLLVFLGAILANISVNALNEYFDFKTGLDFKTLKTPFSGGSGTLINKPQLSRNALVVGVLASLIVVIIGFYFVRLRGLGMLGIGLVGVLVVVLYPVLLIRNVPLSLIAPGLGLGAEVLGTHYALSGVVTAQSIFATLVPFFLVSNLLLLNQFPDMEADRSVGRRNLVIAIGRKKSAYVYAIILACTYLAIITGIVSRCLSLSSAIGLLTVLVAVPATLNAFKNPDDIPKLMPSLGMNILIVLLTPLLLAVGIFVNR